MKRYRVLMMLAMVAVIIPCIAFSVSAIEIDIDLSVKSGQVTGDGYVYFSSSSGLVPFAPGSVVAGTYLSNIFDDYYSSTMNLNFNASNRGSLLIDVFTPDYS